MPKDELVHDRLTESIIGAFYEVYNKLGYGFFEGVHLRDTPKRAKTDPIFI